MYFLFPYRGFPTKMVYLYYISYLRYTILAGNPRYINCIRFTSCIFSFKNWFHTMLDRDNTARPERRTALIAKEPARYRIDIAALSETRLADEGILKEDGGTYTFLWRSKPEAEDRLHGVEFAIRISLMKSIPSLPVWINERLMRLSLVPMPPPLPTLTKQRKSSMKT